MKLKSSPKDTAALKYADQASKDSPKVERAKDRHKKNNSTAQEAVKKI